MDNSKRLTLYKEMQKIRHFENTVSKLFAEGSISGFLHLYIGQEAIAVGACNAINKDDYITSTHRGHGHVIAKGSDLNLVMAEMYAKKTGYCKGKGSSMHIASPELGILGANGIVGGGIPLATGAGMSSKLLGNNRVCVCFFGDGASNQGTFHESINIASAFNLPVIYICENNMYGVGTKQRNVRNVDDIADRAAGYGIPGIIVDGNDVEEVYAEVSKAADRARNGDGPTLIECKTYKWHTHFEGEPDTYRPKEEIASWIEKDPIASYGKLLISEKAADESTLKTIEDEVDNEINAAIKFAEEAPLPEPESALEDVYA